MSDEKAAEGFYSRSNTAILGVVDGIYNAVTRDGTVFAFLRQGANELATAFGQMMPDSATVTEPGSVFHPLHSDLANDRQASAEKPGLPSPSQIAQESNAVGPVRSEPQPDRQPLPSPSEIGREPTPSHPPDQAHTHDNGNGR